MIESTIFDISEESALATERPGFGDYDLPEGKTFEQMQSAAKSQRISFAVLFGILSACSVFLIPVSLTLAIFSMVGFAVCMIAKIIGVVGITNQAPPMGELFPAEVLQRIPQLGEVSSIPCSGFPTKNGPESFDWKLKLIEAARHSIVLSGCYCGDEVFDQTLDLMAKQMNLFPELKIYILSSDAMITPENLVHVEKLRKQFPDRFTCIVTPELFPMVSPTTNQFSVTSNHCKVLVIDGGRYFMLGGTGIAHSFSEEKGLKEPKTDDEKTNLVKEVLDSVLKLKAFRDMDFVFNSSLNGVGTRLHVEMLKLFERMRFRQEGGATLNYSCSESMKDAGEDTCELFHQMERLNSGLKVSCFATGPEHEGNLFLEELIKRVDNATESVVIANLYFHPPARLLQALINAGKRGVKITVLTNKDWAQSPGSHVLYAHRSRYHASKLYDGKASDKIEIYLYEVPYTSLHKKVMVVDGKFTLTGSANMGKKSLENLDYECNLCVESTEFAGDVLKTIEVDKEHCKKVTAEESWQVPWMTEILAPLQVIPMLLV